jgi:hypothetical protein
MEQRRAESEKPQEPPKQIDEAAGRVMPVESKPLEHTGKSAKNDDTSLNFATIVESEEGKLYAIK